MPTADQVRHTIARAMERKGEGPVTVALDLDLERNHLRDFMEGKKDSLKPHVVMALAERYGLDFKDLIIKREKPSRQRRTA